MMPLQEARGPGATPVRTRCCARTKILADLGELVVLRLSAQTALLVDLCAHGAAVQAVYPVAPHTGYELSFRLPQTGEKVEANCEVAWADAGNRAGLRFVSVNDSTRQTLESWLAAHSNEAAAPLAELPPGRIGSREAPGGVVPTLLEAAQSAGAEQATNQQIAALAEKLAVSTVGSPSLRREAIELARTLTGADGAALILQEEHGTVCRASAGNAPDVGAILKPGSRLTAACLRTGEVVRCDDTAGDERVDRSTAERLRLRSIAIVPIASRGSTVGAVEVLSSKASHFTEAHIAILQRVARIIASTLAAEPERAVYGDTAQGLPVLPADMQADFSPKTRVGVFRYVVVLLALSAIAMVLIVTRFHNKDETHPREMAASAQPAAVPGIGEKRGGDLSTAPAPPPGAPEIIPSGEPTQSSDLQGAEGGEANVAAGSNAETELAAIRPIPSQRRAEGAAGHRGEPIAPPALPLAGTEKAMTGSVLDVPKLIPRLAVPSRPLRVSELIPGHPVAQPLPRYPEQAVASRIQGSVVLHLLIGRDGTVKKLRLLEGNSLLARAAMEAVKRWRYEPTYLDRVPIEREFIEELKFTLDHGPQVTLPLHPQPDLLRGGPITTESPEYPEQALRMRIRGAVILRGIVGTDGRMKELRLMEGNPLLAQSAIDAVKKWRYEVSYLHGVPVEQSTIVVVEFRGEVVRGAGRPEGRRSPD